VWFTHRIILGNIQYLVYLDGGLKFKSLPHVYIIFVYVMPVIVYIYNSYTVWIKRCIMYCINYCFGKLIQPGTFIIYTHIWIELIHLCVLLHNFTSVYVYAHQCDHKFVQLLSWSLWLQIQITQNLVLFVVILIASCNAEFQFKCWVASCSKWYNIIVTNCLHINCDWIWQNPASTHRATLVDGYGGSINCISYNFLVDYAEELKITTSNYLSNNNNCKEKL